MMDECWHENVLLTPSLLVQPLQFCFAGTQAPSEWVTPRSGNFRLSQAKVPRTINTFSNIEINDAAITVLKTFSATTPDDRPACNTTNEGSPICVSPAATASAVLTG